jgi:isoleucyl-tRNA synthetase
MAELRLKDNLGFLGYVEGPPTLNGVPHVGHARGRVMKDLRYRWKTMQGYYIPFWAGWDCQGLPVELEVERELGVKNKRELVEKVGEERFIEECKKVVMKYYREWLNADEKLGIFIDQDKAYWTYLDSYIEREWQYLKHAWEQGLLGEGYYVVAYCPHCQTSLSHAEVGLGYEEVEDSSLYFKMKIHGRSNEYFLVWTTMPFTIVTDMMLAVHPEGEYVKIQTNSEIWILARQRLTPVMQELGIQNYKVLETIIGKKLEGTKYEYPFLDLVPKQAELDQIDLIHTVICEDFVDLNTATGIVHLSPGNGEDDFLAAQKRNLPIYVPFDDACNFTADAGAFIGLFARDADSKVIEELKKRNLLVSVKNIRHEYPTCWRSHHKLIWLARKEYFLWTNKINQRVVEAAEKVEYFYESPKNRFLAFLREGKPWCISRERVWGTPLPIWVCEKCGNKIFVAYKKKLLEDALEKPNQDFELHKPWIDRVVLKCEKCGGKMRREPFVLDTWHNSGAAPYARFADEDFNRFVPVDFLVEAIDQTRGWANTLLLEHVILTQKAEAPYKAYLFYGFVLDAKGRKMSKSLGNFIEVNPLLEQTSADLCRFYLLWKCSPIDSMNFDVNELRKRPYQVLSTLYHMHRFFMQNAEYDNFNPLTHTLTWAREIDALKSPDTWLLSKLQGKIENVTHRFERCEFNTALSDLEKFVVDDISRLYIPMIRRELWSDDPNTLNRRLAIYAVLWHVLKTITSMFNPITPFLSEFLYQKVYRPLNPKLHESINFEKWPLPNARLKDETIEKSFETLIKVLSLSYSARQSAKIKRRWPLQKAIVIAPKETIEKLKNLTEIFLELANVYVVEFSEQPVEVDLTRWVSATENNIQILLDTCRDEKLLGKGLMRDLARRIQSLRKELGFMPTEILESVHVAEVDEENTKLLAPYLDEMKELIRTREIHFHVNRSEVETEWYRYELDDKKIYIAITTKNLD